MRKNRESGKSMKAEESHKTVQKATSSYGSRYGESLAKESKIETKYVKSNFKDSRY